MQTSLSDGLFNFSVALAGAARLFSAKQLATHPALSGRSQPKLRARQFLWSHPAAFEKTKSAGNTQWLWRLTSAAKCRYGYTFKSIAGDTQRREHWLGLGDLWLALTYAGGRPEAWRTEPRAQFDADFTWRGKRVLVEYQRTIISPKSWKEKWEKRRIWYKAQNYDEPPIVLLVVTTKQQDSAIHAPKGTVVCRSVNDVPRRLFAY